MTDNEIIQEATEAVEKNLNAGVYVGDLLRIIKEKNAEVEKLNVELVGMRGACESYKIHYDNAQAEIERLQNDRIVIQLDDEILLKDFKTEVKKEINTIKSEAYREFADKITEVFLRYAHLHSHADCARKDYIKADDGAEIEMQSVWDVFTLKKYGIAEYEEMNRLQTNIELIEKGRLLTELEKDFRLLTKELTESKNDLEG